MWVGHTPQRGELGQRVHDRFVKLSSVGVLHVYSLVSNVWGPEAGNFNPPHQVLTFLGQKLCIVRVANNQRVQLP